MNAFPPVRRIVTAVNSAGRSFICADGESPAVKTIEARPGYRNANLWRTLGGDASIAAPDSVEEITGVLPPKGGTVLRVIDFPPEPADPDERRKAAEATFASIFADADHHGGGGRHAAMHTTTTIDYAIVLEGEIVAILDDDETLMRRGDILIQRGTSHGWANRSSSFARLAFILVDAAP